MDLTTVLYIYLIIVIALAIIFWYFGIRPWSSVILAIIFGFILLNIIMPPCETHCYVGTPAYGVYIFIQAATILAVFIYAAIMASWDVRCKK